ncbi:MAG: hypothetical protein ABIK89_23495 [Planctomycetota bacterium]
MPNDPDAVEHVGRPHNPFQFTVRTFFGAALWVSLLLSAVKTLKDEVLATAVLLLVWIAFAELYHRFGAIGPLAALAGGPIFLLMVWGIVYVATVFSPNRDELLPPVSGFFAYALVWGIVLSLVVVIERAIDRWIIRRGQRRRTPNPSGLPGDPPPLRSSGELRRAVSLLSIHTVFALLAIVLSLATDEPAGAGGAAMVVILDLPIVPVYILISALDWPDDMVNLALTSLVLGGALYAVAGWAVGYAAKRFGWSATRKFR